MKLPWVSSSHWVFISSQALARVDDPTLPTGLWLILAGPLWSALAAYFMPRRYREAEADDRNVLTAGGGICLWADGRLRLIHRGRR